MLTVRILLNDTDGKATRSPNREHKGASLLIRTKDFTAIDLETTGLSPAFDSIIELAAVRYRKGIAVESFQQFVNPGYEIDEFITELTGITNDMLRTAPSIEEVLSDYSDFLGNDVLVGHNVNFDINFIYDNCIDMGLAPCSNCFIDTMRISRRMYKEWPDHKLDTLVKMLNISGRDLHRGENDATLAAQCYLAMCECDQFDLHMQTSKKEKNFKAKDIVADERAKNVDSPLYGQVCVFTGALESLTRREAMQLVADIGGICGDNVTKKTNLLILGDNDYCKAIKDGKSNKQKKAEKLILEGADLKIISESVFLDMLANEE